MPNEQQLYLFGQIKTSQAGGQQYSDTTPYGEGESSLPRYSVGPREARCNRAVLIRHCHRRGIPPLSGIEARFLPIIISNHFSRAFGTCILTVNICDLIGNVQNISIIL